MHGADPVVSDTSPLLNLALIGRLDLVRRQFARVTVPEEVWDELLAGEDGVEALRSLKTDETLEVVSTEKDPLFTEFQHSLDRGEAAALAYAVEVDAELVLLDEREARQAARRHDIPTTGAIGVLLRAARNGEVSLQSELDALRSAGFWISDELYEDVLEQRDEDPE